MSSRTLDDLIIEGGIKSAYFFNGRMLSGEDLRQEQAANRQARRDLGQCAGDGVAYGFEVTQKPANLTAPILTVAPGLAINRLGQTLRLATSIDLSLIQPPTQIAGTDVAFRDCTRPADGVYITDSGLYLLAVCPVAARQGRAPVSGLGNDAAACNSKYVVEGVQFLVTRITASELPALDTLRRRNLVAYRCFGYGDWSEVPYSTQPGRIGLLDRLRAIDRLHDCDVPLAVFNWVDASQIEDLDNWCVRRRVTAPWPDAGSFSVLSDVRRSTAEASVLQFRSHLDSLFARGGAATAAQAFRYLPPAGYLTTQQAGFDWRAFLGGLTDRRITAVSHALLRGIVAESLELDPIDTIQPAPVNVYAHDANDTFVVFARTRYGRVVASFAGSPPSGAVAVLVSQHSSYEATMQVTGSGNSRSADGAPGTYVVEVEATNHNTYTSSAIQVIGGEFTTVSSIALIPTVTIGSIAVDMSLVGVMIELVTVSITGPGGTHTTTRTGLQFFATDLDPGTYLVEARLAFVAGNFFMTWRRAGVQVTAGATTTVIISQADNVLSLS